MLKDVCESFVGKKITVLGLGLLGRGVGDAAFLAECGAEVLVTDKKTEEELAESVAQLKKYPNITFHLGGHHREDFEHCDMVLKAAGVRLDSPEVAAARARNIPVMMSTALFAKYAAEMGAIIVGVTGTRGKSTVTSMIHHVLTKKGKRAMLGGNVRGVSTLAMLPEIQKGDIAVLELDSWQLQGFGDLKISPHIAVFSNLMPDHQNYYKDMDEYFADKANIFKYQKAGDVLVIGPSIADQVYAARPAVEPTVPGSLAPDWDLKIPGTHNRENASLAASALLSLGLNIQEIKNGLESFESIEGRLQLVGEKASVKIYNDNNATTPEATIAALTALAPEKPVLIIGGSDKGLSLMALSKMIPDHVRAVVYLKGSGTEKLQMNLTPLLEEKKIKSIESDSIDSAVQAAMVFAEGKGTILFSPAFASFGMFANEYERNDQFLAFIKEK